MKYRIIYKSPIEDEERKRYYKSRRAALLFFDKCIKNNIDAEIYKNIETKIDRKDNWLLLDQNKLKKESHES